MLSLCLFSPVERGSCLRLRCSGRPERSAASSTVIPVTLLNLLVADVSIRPRYSEDIHVRSCKSLKGQLLINTKLQHHPAEDSVVSPPLTETRMSANIMSSGPL